jgi:hypothetical protein
MPLWIECKTSVGRQSTEQKQFQKYVEENWMSYLLARSVDDVINWLEEHR